MQLGSPGQSLRLQFSFDVLEIFSFLQSSFPPPLFRPSLVTSLHDSPLCLPHPPSPFLLVLIPSLFPSPANQACPSLSGQRITGSQLSPRLQNFGQSLSGGQDLTQDGLVDLAVGARGHALLLR